MRAMESVLLNSVYDFAEDTPDRLVLVPTSGSFSGIDGRIFINSNPQRIVERWKKTGHDIPVDIEHSTELRGPQGFPAPAVGWVSDLVISENGGITGSVTWTEEGKELVASRKYRYFSPAYLVDRNTKEIAGIRSIGLTNVPNLGVPSLNSEGNEEGEDMEKDLKVICNSLGIAEGATEAEVVTEINSLKTRLAAAENRAAEAEQKIREQEDAAFKAELNSAVEKGVEDGKIAPAQKDYFLTSINSQEALASFRAMLEKSPRVIEDGETVTGKPEGEDKVSLNAEERAMCEALGVSEEEYRKAKEDK